MDKSASDGADKNDAKQKEKQEKKSRVQDGLEAGYPCRNFRPAAAFSSSVDADTAAELQAAEHRGFESPPIANPPESRAATGRACRT